MNRSTWAALVVALMLGSGIAGYLIGSPRRHGRPSTANPNGPDHTDAPHRPNCSRRAAHQPRRRPPSRQPPRPVPVEPFRYSRLSLDNSSAEAEACLYFNKPLAADER